MPFSSYAKELYFKPSIKVTGEYDDNKRLLSERFEDAIDTSTYGLITSFDGILGVRSDLYDINLDAKVNINRYFGDFDLDSDDVFLNLTSGININERNRLGLEGKYTRDTTLTSELDVTGFVQENIPRELWSITPDWTFNLSESKFIQANYSHTEVSYEQSQSIFQNQRLFDFVTDSASITFVHQWNESLQNYATFSALYFDVPEIGRETDEYTINVGMEYNISETWTAGMSLGGRFTHTDLTFQSPVLVNGLPVIRNGNFVTEELTVSDDAQGLIFSFSTNKQFETGSMGASYERSTSPQGNGRLQLFDRFSVNYLQRFSRQLTFSLAGGINVSSTSGGVESNNDRTYYYVNPTLRWNLNRQASISGGYRFRMQEFESNDQQAVSNAVFINLNYQWDKLSTQEY